MRLTAFFSGFRGVVGVAIIENPVCALTDTRAFSGSAHRLPDIDARRWHLTAASSDTSELLRQSAPMYSWPKHTREQLYPAGSLHWTGSTVEKYYQVSVSGRASTAMNSDTSFSCVAKHSSQVLWFDNLILQSTTYRN